MMKNESLTTRTVRTAVISSLLLGIIALVIGLSVYITTVVRQYVDHAFETANHAWLSAKHGSDSLTLAKDVMDIYRSLTPEQREKMHTDPEEYRSYYSSIDTTVGGGGTWDVLINLLDTFVIDLDDVYLGMYDEETSALVYFANADDEIIMYPGDWEKVSQKEINKFLNWDGTGSLYEISWTEEYGLLCTAGYPIWTGRRNEGELREFLLVDVAVGNVVDGVADFTVKVSLGVLLATGVMVWFIRRRIKKTGAEPIDAIANAAVEYVKGKKEGVEGDHFASLNISTGDELENLSHVMADMEKDLAQHEEHIRAITAEKERINTELDMATRIQKSMLPQGFPAFPDRHEFDIYASMDPALEVGGDFYNFFLIDSDHLCLIIADVSGKGVPGALFMMLSKVILESCAKMCKSAAETLATANEAICANNKMEMFVTVWVGILEISTGRMTCANAGHEYPAICHVQDGRFSLLKDRHGFVIGGMKGMRYKEYEFQMQPGDKVFVYTDGVAEAANSRDEFFGTDRMLAALNEHPEASPKETLKAVRTAVDKFVSGGEQFDDLTMLCLEYKGM